MKIFPPIEASFPAPFLVQLVVLLNTHPLKNNPGLTVVTSPPKFDNGPNCINVAVEFSVKFIGAFPSCVNCFNCK